MSASAAFVASLRRRVEASKHESNQCYHLDADATLVSESAYVGWRALVSYVPLASFNFCARFIAVRIAFVSNQVHLHLLAFFAGARQRAAEVHRIAMP